MARYKVTLRDEEIEELTALIKKGGKGLDI